MGYEILHCVQDDNQVSSILTTISQTSESYFTWKQLSCKEIPA